MNIEEQVIEAQRDIIDSLVCCEEAISKLYAVYSKAHPDLEKFWDDLSQREEAHAKLLRTMHKQLDKGSIFRNIGRFDSGSVESFLSTMSDAIKHAEEDGVSQTQAIKTALSIESSVLDAHFYDIVKSDAQEYRIIADRLSIDTHDHVNAVQNKLMEIQANKSV